MRARAPRQPLSPPEADGSLASHAPIFQVPITQRHRRRLWAAGGWIGGSLALLAFFLRIAVSVPVNSDGANNALQAWDMLHGNLLLHGWILGDATFYAFELPLLAVTEFCFGLRDLSSYIASSLTYWIVAVCAVALAVRGGSGARVRVARCAVTVAVLCCPLAIPYGLWVEIGAPDHMGSSVFLLVPILLIDRVSEVGGPIGRARWYGRLVPPLVCVILCAGQLSDATVQYIAVPAIVVVCAYRMVAARRLRTADVAAGLAAVASVPLELGVRALLQHAGGYQMVLPRTKLASPGQWPHNAALAWQVLQLLYGAMPKGGKPLGGALTYLGLAWLLAAAAGLLAVGWRWRRASRAEQMLAVAAAANIVAYIVSTLSTSTNSHEIAAVLPCGAVLTARLLVPGRIGAAWGTTARWRALAGAAVAAAAAVALLPLAVAATFAPAQQPMAPAVAWLAAHHLRYGISTYWESSAATEDSDGQVAIRTASFWGTRAGQYNWESDTGWYNPSRNDATFVAVPYGGPKLTVQVAKRTFGKPAWTGQIPGWEFLVYDKNLLAQVQPG